MQGFWIGPVFYFDKIRFGSSKYNFNLLIIVFTNLNVYATFLMIYTLKSTANVELREVMYYIEFFWGKHIF